MIDPATLADIILKFGVAVVFVFLSLAIMFAAWGWFIRMQKAPKGEATTNQLLSSLVSPLGQLVTLMGSMERSSNQQNEEQQKLLATLSSNFEKQTETLLQQSNGQKESAATLLQISNKLDGLGDLRIAIEKQSEVTTTGLENTRTTLTAQLVANTSAINAMHQELLRLVDSIPALFKREIDGAVNLSLDNQNRIEAAASRRFNTIEEKIMSQSGELKTALESAVQGVISEVQKIFPLLERIAKDIDKSTDDDPEPLVLMRAIVASQEQIAIGIKQIVSMIDALPKPQEQSVPTTQNTTPESPDGTEKPLA